MLFNSFQYWIFFLMVAVLFYSMPFRIGKLLLLCASYVFYMWWDPRFIVLILTSTVVDYFLGIWLEVTSGRRKKILLAISLVVNLGILGFFKYYDFFAGSLAGLLHIPKSSVVLQVVLPVGVSFYTFASLSYTLDVYWGKMKAVRNLIDYALFIAFFPHLIAGPIIRARQFISQIQYWRRPAAIVIQSGIVLVLSGLLKKMVLPIVSRSCPTRTLATRPHTRAGWLHGQAALLSLCRYSLTSLVTPTSLAVAPSCSALNFRLILPVRSYPEIRLTSGSDGTSHFPHGCGTIYLCHSAGEEKGGSCYIATWW